MGAIITVVVMLMLCSVVLFLTLKMLRSQASKSVGKERDVFLAEAGKYDSAIDQAVARLDGMVSLNDIYAIEERKKVLEGELVEENGKVRKIQGELDALQAKVDKQEAKQNELKRGKEDADRIADEIRANKEKLLEEGTRLKAELNQSQQQIEALVSEVQASPAQQEAINEITTSLARSADQLAELIRVNDLSTSRFLNLQNQYQELEKEFRKLVDKELAGT